MLDKRFASGAKALVILEQLEGLSDSTTVALFTELRAVIAVLLQSSLQKSAEETEEDIPIGPDLRELIETPNGIGAMYNSLSDTGKHRLVLALYNEVLLFDLDTKDIDQRFVLARDALRTALVLSNCGMNLSQKPLHFEALAQVPAWLRSEQIKRREVSEEQ